MPTSAETAPSHLTQGSRRIIGLDLVRAIAILLVLICHTNLHIFRLPTFFVNPPGVSGVEVFFVLSGFLIGRILIRQIVRSGDFTQSDLVLFWVRRWWRTVPNYLLFFVINLLLNRGDLPREPWRYVLFLQNITPGLSTANFFGESWSLSVEEWMYLVLPASFLIILMIRRKRSIPVSLRRTIALIMFLSLGLRLIFASGQPWDMIVRKTVIYRLDSIATGVMLAYISIFHPRLFHRMSSRDMSLLGAALIAVSALWIALLVCSPLVSFDGIRGIGMNGLIFTLLDSGIALLIARAYHIAKLPPLLSSAVSRISLYSYSMYLCHVPLLFVLFLTVPHYVHGEPWLFPTSVVLYPGFVYLTSAMLYHYFERPTTNLRERFPAGSILMQKPQIHADAQATSSSSSSQAA